MHSIALRALLFLAALILPVTVSAEGTAHLAGEIYNAGGGARALAMGGAHTAVVNDVTAMYYNPAGLATLPGRQFQLMQAALYEGAAYNYIGYAQNMKKRPGGWGVEILRLGAGGGKGRDKDNLSTSDFGYAETSMAWGFGVRGIFLPQLSAGMKFKRLTRSLGGSSDNHTSIDVGGQFGPIASERVMLGFTMQNAFSQVKGDTSDRLPMTMRVGAAYSVRGNFVVSADLSNHKEFRFGTEYQWGITSLRAGFEPAGVTFGTGFLFRQAYTLDIAMINHPTLGLSQRLSLGYKFKGKSGKKMEAFADEYLKNAMMELEKRNYAKASKDLDTALGINSRLGDMGWKSKAKRLRDAVEAMELTSHPEDQNALRQATVQAALAQQAIMAYVEGDDSRAMLFAHAAHGQDTREGAGQKLLKGLSKLTRIEVRREDILPPVTLANRKLREAVEAIYLQKFDIGIKSCKDALILDPNSALAWTRLGSAYFAAGDKANAMQAWKNSLQLDPANDKLRQFMKAQGMPL